MKKGKVSGDKQYGGVADPIAFTDRAVVSITLKTAMCTIWDKETEAAMSAILHLSSSASSLAGLCCT